METQPYGKMHSLKPKTQLSVDLSEKYKELPVYNAREIFYLEEECKGKRSNTNITKSE